MWLVPCFLASTRELTGSSKISPAFVLEIKNHEADHPLMLSHMGDARPQSAALMMNAQMLEHMLTLLEIAMEKSMTLVDFQHISLLYLCPNWRSKFNLISISIASSLDKRAWKNFSFGDLNNSIRRRCVTDRCIVDLQSPIRPHESHYYCCRHWCGMRTFHSFSLSYAMLRSSESWRR